MSRSRLLPPSSACVVAVSALVVALLPGLAAGAPGAADGRTRTATPLAVDAVATASAGSADGLTRVPRVAVDASSQQPQAVYVQLRGDGAADAADAVLGGRGGPDRAQRTALDRRSQITGQSRTVLAAARTVDGSAERLFTTTDGLPGVGLLADDAAVEALSRRPDVASVSRLSTLTTDSAGPSQRPTTEVSSVATSGSARSAPSTATTRTSATRTTRTTPVAWAGAARSSAARGEGVSIGVIDSGLDFTHADFGGLGTAAAYAAAYADSTSATWRDSLTALARLKIGGGYDFAGDDYNADLDSDSYQPTPHPDPDPLDCAAGLNSDSDDDAGGHGTHVAGTAAGYGVTTDGRTYDGAGGYDDPRPALRVAPGPAPAATLYPLRIFGCDGTSNLLLPALDWALDPNGDGDFADHLDVVNLSLGGTFGAADAPESRMVDALSRQGVLTVAAAGNGGDLTDVGGSPGNALSALTVADADTGEAPYDGLRVEGSDGLAGVYPAQFSLAYDWSNTAPVTGDVVTLPGDNADGCTAYSAEEQARVAGRVVWLDWDDDTRRCGSVDRADLAQQAGAAGVILTSGVALFTRDVTGNAGIPLLQLTGPATSALQAAAADGDLRVTLDGALAGQGVVAKPDAVDTLQPLSSRGTHGLPGGVKPDVAAPGVGIASAAVGTGSGLSRRTGTSMAAPDVAGIAATVRGRHPAWGPMEVKAAVMNTADRDLWSGPDHTGARYGPARVGSGAVDAAAAQQTSVIAYTKGRDKPVSASFGVQAINVGQAEVRRQRTLVVANKGTRPVSVDLAYDAVVETPGVDVTVSPATLTVEPGLTATATITLSIRPGDLRHTLDPTMAADQAFGNAMVPRQFVTDASGRVVVTPTDGGAALRVPVYAAPKPASTTRAVATGDGIALRGTGVAQGDDTSAYVSRASVLQLGATSPELPACTGVAESGCTATSADRAADLAAVGLGSTPDWLWYGVATHGQGDSLGRTVVPFVDLDVDEDGVPDYETQVTVPDGTDVPVSATWDLHQPFNALPVDIQPTNTLTGITDTNVFDTDVVLMPVSLLSLSRLTAGATLTYTVGTVNKVSQKLGDAVGPVSYDTGAPDVAVDQLVYPDRGGVRIPVTHTPGAHALVVHLHGRPGRQAEVVDLP